jgi:CRISPR-associated protein Csb1
MEQQETPRMMLKTVQDALADNAAAFRLTLALEPVSPKVFPPTYAEGKYATEKRRISGKEVDCVLLDSVASQANRMELALQEAWESGTIELPVTSVDFSKAEGPDGDPYLKTIKITSLQAPHRISDAILRDSALCQGEKVIKFRETEIGKALDDLVALAYATPLLRFAPHCLVFGLWHSTGWKRRSSGVKIPRAVTSEIIGVNAVGGVRTSSRIDPLNIRINSGILYQAEDGYTLDENGAVKDKDKAHILGDKGKPSEANHGNVTPSISDGGFTIDCAEQITVLSLPALRRLRFPLKPGKKSSPESDNAARTYLAALGLLGATLAVGTGFDLRSRCVLRPTGPVVWHLLGCAGEGDEDFQLSPKDAVSLYRDALAAVENAGLPIEKKEIVLTPSDDLVTLVKKSMELAAAETGGK